MPTEGKEPQEQDKSQKPTHSYTQDSHKSLKAEL